MMIRRLILPKTQRLYAPPKTLIMKPHFYSTTPQQQLSQQPLKSDKYLLEFTCKVCSNRQQNKISKLSYSKGVVIVTCQQCKNKHLIADHLGWFDSSQKAPGTIEDILKRKGEGISRISFASSTEVDEFLEEKNQKLLFVNEEERKK